MITDLASNERYEDVLQGIVASSLRTAVGAGGALLALEPRPGMPTEDLLRRADGSRRRADRRRPPGTGRRRERASPSRWHRPVATTASWPSRGRWPVLRTVTGTLETYGRLAAATLDAADAMDEARHQANTAQVLSGTVHLAGRDREHRGDGVEGGPRGARRHRLRPRRRLPQRRGLAGRGRDDFRLAGSTATPTRRSQPSARSPSPRGRPTWSIDNGIVRTTFSATSATSARSPPRSSWPAAPSAPSWPA